MKKSVAREYFESLVIAVILALFVRTWVFQAFKIPTGSMEPNLLVGDHLIVNKMEFSPAATGLERAIMPHREIRRGDVIVFKYPVEPERDFIKRVIGLPGDRLELRRKQILTIGDADCLARRMRPSRGDGAENAPFSGPDGGLNPTHTAGL